MDSSVWQRENNRLRRLRHSEYPNNYRASSSRSRSKRKGKGKGTRVSKGAGAMLMAAAAGALLAGSGGRSGGMKAAAPLLPRQSTAVALYRGGAGTALVPWQRGSGGTALVPWQNTRVTPAYYPSPTTGYDLVPRRPNRAAPNFGRWVTGASLAAGMGGLLRGQRTPATPAARTRTSRRRSLSVKGPKFKAVRPERAKLRRPLAGGTKKVKLTQLKAREGKKFVAQLKRRLTTPEERWLAFTRRSKA